MACATGVLGNKVSVMGSGMGMPSMGTYACELFEYHDVENIIRVASENSYTAELEVYDVVLWPWALGGVCRDDGPQYLNTLNP